MSEHESGSGAPTTQALIPRWALHLREHYRDGELVFCQVIEERHEEGGWVKWADVRAAADALRSLPAADEYQRVEDLLKHAELDRDGERLFRQRAEAEVARLTQARDAPLRDPLAGLAEAFEPEPEVLTTAKAALAAEGALGPLPPAKEDRTAEDSGLCCLRDHANAVPPWTCACPCHRNKE